MQGRGATRRPWPRARPACTCAQESGHRARSLWGGGAAHAEATRVRRAARVGIGAPTLECRRASDRALSFGAKGPREQNFVLSPSCCPRHKPVRSRNPHAGFAGEWPSPHVTAVPMLQCVLPSAYNSAHVGPVQDCGATCRPASSTVRSLAREDPRVLIGWPLPLDFGLDGRLLLAWRWQVYV